MKTNNLCHSQPGKQDKSSRFTTEKGIFILSQLQGHQLNASPGLDQSRKRVVRRQGQCEKSRKTQDKEQCHATKKNHTRLSRNISQTVGGTVEKW